jgi:hypothetical protein
LLVRVGINAPNVGFTTYYPAQAIADVDIERSFDILEETLLAEL